MNLRKLHRLLLVLVLSLLLSPASAAEDGFPEVVGKSGIKGGVIVHLGCGDGSGLAALPDSSTLVVEGLDTDRAKVSTGRAKLLDAGRYGRLALHHWDGRHLPYVDNFVNLIVVSDPAEAARAELLRVLAPNGQLWSRAGGEWTREVKPWPKEMGQWTHYFHGPDGNPVSPDTMVGPPTGLQWLGSPRWARHHDHVASLSAMVSANGRLFYIIDEGSRASIQLPAHWKLVARDAFNGMVLWKRDIPRWIHKDFPLKSGPAHLLRKLVAVGDRVYVTLGLDAPVSELDAVTGKTLRVFEGSRFTREIVVTEGHVLALAAQRESKLAGYRRLSSHVWTNRNRANVDYSWTDEPRRILAFDRKTAALSWKRNLRVAPCSLAADGTNIVFHNGERLRCLKQASGENKWSAAEVSLEKPVCINTGPRVLIWKDRVLLGGYGHATRMSGWSLKDGKRVWEQPYLKSGHYSIMDLFVIGGTAWTGAIASHKSQDGTFKGYDARYGAQKRSFKPDVRLQWFHHRCYPAKATAKYLITARNGTEYVDLEKERWIANHWVRGGCAYGVMPANGMTYAPMDACGCQLEAKLKGLKALNSVPAPKPSPESLDVEARLEKGPAYGKVTGADSGPSDWPTYRRTASRSGSTGDRLVEKGAGRWRTRLGGGLTAPTVAAGKVLVASQDTHTLYALSCATGKTLWRYTTGARSDTPPTYHKGMLLLGCADGYVYALRAADGVLAWRFRAAPLSRRMMAWERIESPWPVHGSVLVRDGIAYCTAGRSIYLDGGIRFLRLEAATGKLLGERVWNEKDPDSGKNMHEAYVKRGRGGINMPVGLSDVLSCDGKHLWMRSQKIDFEGKRQEIALRSYRQQTAEDAHLFCQIGMCDDSWFFRSYWSYGRRVGGGNGAWHLAGRFVPSGRILCFDEKAAYGFGRQPAYMTNSSVVEYRLFSARKTNSPEDIEKNWKDSRRISARRPVVKRADNSDWRVRWFFKDDMLTANRFSWKFEQPAVFGRALCATPEILYVAGPPDVLDERMAWHRRGEPEILKLLARQERAFRGEEGGRIWAVSKKDGKPVARHALEGVPVFDGMIVAGGRLILSMTDGRVLSLSKSGLSALPSLRDQPAQVIWKQPEDPGYLTPKGEEQKDLKPR